MVGERFSFFVVEVYPNGASNIQLPVTFFEKKHSRDPGSDNTFVLDVNFLLAWL